MVNRFEDLAPIIAPTGVARGSTVGYRQGVVESWNPTTAENTIRIGGTLFTNLTSIASSSEVLLIKPGDVVGVAVVSGQSAWDSMYVLGRITVPGTPQAGSFMELFGAKAASIPDFETRSSTSFGDLATVGPQVTNVTVGKTGRLLVLFGCHIHETSTNIARGGAMSFEITGASSVSPDFTRRFLVSHSDDGIVSGGASSNNLRIRGLSAELVTGLNAGSHTVTAKYRSESGVQVAFGERILIAIPF